MSDDDGMSSMKRQVITDECDVATARLNLAGARLKMEIGFKKAQAEFDIECERLKSEFQAAEIKLRREEAFLAQSRGDLERGFET